MPRMTPVALLILSILLSHQVHATATETFDTHFMMGGAKDQKVSNFSLDESKPLPGQYELDIYVNKQWRGRYEVNVGDEPDNVCLTDDILHNLGVITDDLKPQVPDRCITLKRAIRSGSYTFDIGIFRLDMSVPQSLCYTSGGGLCFTRELGTRN